MGYVLRKPALRALNPRSGQTALEYIIVFAVLLAAAAVALYFLRAPGAVADYSVEVICSDKL